METEIRFYYSLTERDKINNYLKKFKELKNNIIITIKSIGTVNPAE